MTDVVVVGAGAAGTAAALTAAGAGASVVLLDGGPGATALSTGAVDLVPWERAQANDRSTRAAVPAEVLALLDALGGYVLRDRPALLATTSGIVRRADGHDAALLDLGALAGRRVGVVRCGRPGWDADGLAASWGESFVPVDATVLRYTDERDLPDADFAARHDDDARVEWLAERLRDAMAHAGASLGALIVPPSLGIERARAADLTKLVGVPCGEPMALPGGPPGLRFERARDRALAAAGVLHRLGRAVNVERSGEGWSVVLDGSPEAVDADVVVLAAGGLIGGGIEYAPAEAILASALPPLARPPFRLGIGFGSEERLALGVHGRALEVPGSLFGVPPESLAWPFADDPPMERVGLLTESDGRVSPRLYAAGELVADAPRTWLQALLSGARAGDAAARARVPTTATRTQTPSARDATPPSRP
jgi:glycerol-3-phosphate dehydrogenase subunit B